MLPDEDAFFAYEDPQCAGECEELDDLAELIGGADIGEGEYDIISKNLGQTTKETENGQSHHPE